MADVTNRLAGFAAGLQLDAEADSLAFSVGEAQARHFSDWHMENVG